MGLATVFPATFRFEYAAGLKGFYGCNGMAITRLAS